MLWRTVSSREAGVTVSANMAPASRTSSMQHVKTVAVGLEGQRHFAPLRAFDADTSASLMAALLLYDLGCDGSSAHPGWRRRSGERSGGRGSEGDGKGKGAAHPMDVFGATAVHGGTWRCAYTVDSIGKAAYVMGSIFG